MEPSYNLADSTDWISTSLPAFEPLEAALRCEVCKEFYTNPVITSCSHTFCSLCIRRCIADNGKCPSCKAGCSADKLNPNIAVREVVSKFQEARPKALHLARADKENPDMVDNGKKRKLSETDLQEEQPGRETRSRQTRSRTTGRAEGTDDMPIEVLDSEDDGDDDFKPEGMVNCPICNGLMKEELVFPHLNECPGPNGSQGRRTRTKQNNAFSNPLQRRQKEPSPPPTRLSQFNYAMLKETALRKKLSDIGIPSWGSKDLLKRRHIEWLNIFNANCDADENMRKPRAQMLRELNEWEQTQGGRADCKEPRVMRKDFDGSGHASTHKSQFDDLIANARKQRVKKEETGEMKEDGSNNSDETHQASAGTNAPVEQAINAARPYEGNEAALASIREKVEEANRGEMKLPSLSREPSRMTSGSPTSTVETPTGILNPLGSPSRKVPMFALPEEPIVDVENSTAVQ